MDEVSPDHLRTGVEFQMRLRGYDPGQVDDLLDRIATGIEVLQQQLHDALERAVRAERQAAESLETTRALRDTLGRSDPAAGPTDVTSVTREAEEAAARVTAEAEAKAASIVEHAQLSAAGILSRAEQDLRADLARLEAIRTGLRVDGQQEEARADTPVGREAVTVTTPAGADAGAVPAVAMPAADSPAETDPVSTAGDDPFLTELRKAASDESPLGPRDDGADPLRLLDHAELDLPDHPRWALRRRR